MGTPRLLARLKARQPVTLLTMGGSLTDKRHWAYRSVLWVELLVAKLKVTFGGGVTFVDPVIGGTHLTRNLMRVPLWLHGTPESDQVTVWSGDNDWDAGARAPDWRGKLRSAVDGIGRLTKGCSEVLLIAPCPALERWKRMSELAEATRDMAAEKRAGLADGAAAFRAHGNGEATRATLFARDSTHLGEAGHQLAADTVFQALPKQSPSTLRC